MSVCLSFIANNWFIFLQDSYWHPVFVTVADPNWAEHEQQKVGVVHARLNMQTLFPGVPGNVRVPLVIVQSTDNPQPFLYIIRLECSGAHVPLSPRI